MLCRRGKKATPAKKGHKAPKAAKQLKPVASARDGSKTAKILDLLKRPGGATAKELKIVAKSGQTGRRYEASGYLAVK